MEKCYVSVCFFPKPCFQEMVENEKLAHARTHPRLRERWLLLSVLQARRIPAASRIAGSFLKTLQAQPEARQIPGLICREKERPPPSS